MARVLVVGAGPAGASLAFLLASRGVEVALLERQRDFAREFRGEVLMPSGIAALEAMGLGAVLRAVPTATPESVELFLRGRRFVQATLDPALFGGQPPMAVSQPALLEAIVAEAARFPGFELVRGAAVRDVVLEGGRAVAVRLDAEGGGRELAGDLVVGTDGRASVVRRRSGLPARETAPPMDVVWCKLPPLPGFAGARGYLGRGHLLLAYRSPDDLLQLGWAILKGTFGELRRRGLAEWIEDMARHASPDLAAHLRVHGASVTHPFLLDAVSDRVTRWTAPGVLVLGDAAHTTSPVGGQGLNLALRDAIVAANRLVPALRAGAGPAAIDAAAARVQEEREPEIAAVQRAQALPPRVALSRAWWGEPLRRTLVALAGTGAGRAAFARTLRLFAFGATPVRLEV